MPLRTVRISSLENLALNRIKELEPRIDSTVYGSITTNLIRSLAVAVHPLTYLAQDILDDAFPQTAKGEALDKFGQLDSVERKQASQSIGKISVFGTLGATVPLGEEFDADNVTIYTKNPATIESVTLTITSISSANGVVTCQTFGEHWLARDATVSVSTSEPLLNGTHKVIALVDGLGFKFEIEDKNTIAPLLAGTVSMQYAVIDALSKDSGIEQNVAGGVALSGDYEAYLTYNGMSGGAGAESDADYSQRIIATRNLIEGVFNAPQVALAALSVEGNTRSWVVSPLDGVFGGTEGVAGYKPQPGQVCVYVMRDNDTNPLPNPSVLLATRGAIVEKGKMPVHTIKEDIFVFSPTLTPCNFTITGLVPDTAGMRTAITNELAAFIADYLSFEEPLSVNQQISIITNTRDAQGNKTTQFNVTNGAFDAGSGGLLTFGAVSWE